MMRIAVLAVQGAFIEQEQMLQTLGAEPMEIRSRKDLEQPFDGLILPGGESTVMGKLLGELDLFAPLKARIQAGLPVLGTCAGLILLAEQLSNDSKTYFGTLPVTVRRNAYGRQLGSFSATAPVKGVGPFPMVFIRAPYIERVREGVEVLAKVDGKIAAVRYQNQMGLSFHPELTDNPAVHQAFLDMVRRAKT